MDRKELSKMTAVELYALAGRLELPLKKRMKKAEVIDLLSKAKAPESFDKTSSEGDAGRPQDGHGHQAAPEPGMKQSMEESKFYTGPVAEHAFGLPSELPHGYDDDMIALMVRDPYWAYTYWEVTHRKLDMARASLGESGSDANLALRLYDVTDVLFDGTNAHGHRDFGIYDRIGNWFIDIGRPGRSFIIDLGLKTKDGRFVTLARSNAVKAPRDGVSDVLDEEWVLPESAYDRIFAMSGGYGGIGLSSADVRLAASQRVPFGIASPGMGSLALMSPIKKRQRSFWYVLNAELIVYGATEPDAKVTVQGSPVDLRPDGTFTMRFALPDGTQVIPVSFTSGDEVDTGWITPKVNRQTS